MEKSGEKKAESIAVPDRELGSFPKSMHLPAGKYTIQANQKTVAIDPALTIKPFCLEFSYNEEGNRIFNFAEGFYEITIKGLCQKVNVAIKDCIDTGGGLILKIINPGKQTSDSNIIKN